MSVVLKADEVAIRYITGDFKDIGVKEYAMRKLTQNYHVTEFMAVGGVSFALEAGDMLGIIGSNGAGKSTLLKAIAGIMEPTKGKITAEGEVVALLELGSGFDGDLTVRENAYLRGAMLGYTREFMDSTYAQIIEFAELQEFEDRPFKQLSSGMKSRLAFSIASLVEPDILILDEVLSVGDGAFQEKSACKMREIIARGATTILVSHSLGQIRSLCNKVLWLDHGCQVAFGDSEEICDQYERFLRGECPAKMNKEACTEQAVHSTQSAPAVRVGQRTGNSLGLRLLKALVPSIIIAAVIAFASYQVYNLSVHAFSRQAVTLTALAIEDGADGTPITLRGAIADGTWLNVADIATENTWSENPTEMTLTSVGENALELVLPQADKLQLVFDVGPEQGIVQASMGDSILRFDLYSQQSQPQGLSFALPAQLGTGVDNVVMPWAIAIAAFAVALLGCLYLSSRVDGALQERKEQEVWGSLLRAFCAFVIVWLHCSCTAFDTFSDGAANWYPSLVVNSFTAFAVPCFYMLSGAYLLRREHGIRETLVHRAPKIVIPLLFWSIVYIVVNGNDIPDSFVKMFFSPQASHLWFMYCLFGIYMLLPLLSKLYFRLDGKSKFYLVILLLIVPAVLHDGQSLIGRYAPMPYFAIFWPDLGIFFLGAIIWEYREKIQRKWKLHGAVFLLGFAMTIVFTLLTSMRDGAPNKSFISCIGSTGVLLMAAAVLCLGLAAEQRLTRLPALVRSGIHTLGTVSMGIYFIHVLAIGCFQALFLRLGIFQQGVNSQWAMLGLAVVCFGVSALICWSGKKMAVIRRLF